ncbi:MAG: hypothetical protein WBA54_10635 [Acidaminobacteraceae bacterium]
MSEDKLDLQQDISTEHENITDKPKVKKPISTTMKFGLFLVIILALLGAAFASGIFTSNKAANMLTLAYVKNMNIKQVDASIDMTMESLTDSKDEGLNQAANIINHLIVNAQVKANLTSADSFKLLESLTYNYDDTEMFSLNVFMDNNTIATNVPGLLDEYIYANYDDVMKLFADRFGVEFKGSVSDYYKLFTTEDIYDYAKIALDYGKFTMEKINGNIYFGEQATITTKGDNPKDYLCDQVILSLTGEEYVKLYVELINKAMLDSRIEGLVKAKLDAAIEISKDNGVLEMMKITEEQLLTFDETFSSEYAKIIEELKTEIESEDFKEQLSASMPSDDTFKFIFFIDQDKNIRAINEDFVTITKIPSLDETQEIMTTKVKVEIVYNSFDDVTIDKPNLESSYNITVEPEATAINLFMEIQGKLGSYLEDRPALKNIIESPGMIY